MQKVGWDCCNALSEITNCAKGNASLDRLVKNERSNIPKQSSLRASKYFIYLGIFFPRRFLPVAEVY